MLCASMFMNVGGLGPEALSFVLPNAIPTVPMKKHCATIIGKNFVDRSAASALAVN